MTVWDVKAKKESLTLNNHGRKPVSAVAWNPDVPTKLATAIPTDQEPLILLWDLRNSSAPERTIRGHDSGILSLSWCPYDSELLLSCGKDNRNICWSASTGQMYGEFPLVTNWTFQTRWSSSHPNLLATASFDSKIVIQSIQNTTSGPNDGAVTNQAADGEDFFAKAQTQPQSSSFSLNRPPKWMRCPVGVSFGFGGKLVKLQPANEQLTSSTIRLEPFAPDSTVASSISEFQDAVKGDDVSEMCSSRASKAADDETKEDWKVIKALVSRSPRNEILSFLGYADAVAPEKEIDGNGKIPEKSSKGGLGEGVVNGEAKKSNRLSAFFENTGEGSNFLSDLAASKDARTNNPFSIFTGSESSAEKDITRALMLGKFEDALDLCLKESRMSDAFMFAICGGQKCIDKVRTAYFDQRSGGPNYLRLLASVVGKNLWDVVYNAELKDWKEVMATLCTFADESEFPDLCEALGDRLEESDAPRTDATFCYLTGSKLEKVVPIWVTEMQKGEKKARSKESETGSAFSIHVQALQSFIEKVSIFRRATNFEDKALHGMENDLKLKPLYSYYTEYAEVAAAHGHLDLAEEYLSLIPNNFVGTDIARNRLKRAIEKPARAARMDPRAQPAVVPSFDPYANVAQPSAPQPATGASYMPTNTFSAAPPQPGPSSYTPAPAFGSSYQPAGAQTNAPPNAAGPPPPGSSGPPPPKATNGANWNDLPDSFQKPPTSRRATPNPGVIQAPPMMNQQGPGPYGPPSASSERSRSPLPPPPKAGQGPPRVSSSGYDRPLQPTSSPPQRPPSSTAASSYAPQQAPRPMQTQPQVARTSSPYNAPPSGPPASNRYAPAPSTQPAPTPQGYGSQPPLGPRAVAPNPYAPSTQYAPQQGQFNQGPPSNGPASQPPASTGPPPAGPPPMARGPPQGPPQGPPPGGPRPGLAQSTNTSSQVEQRHRKFPHPVPSSIRTKKNQSTRRPLAYPSRLASDLRHSSSRDAESEVESTGKFHKAGRRHRKAAESLV